MSEASRDGEDYRLNADKSFTTSSGQADFYVAQTRTPGAKDQADIIFFIVDGKAEGIESKPWEALGVRANHSGGISYKNVHVPRRDRLGAEGQGKEIIYDGVSPVYLIGLGAVWEGLARGVLNAAVAHTTGFVHKDRNKSRRTIRRSGRSSAPPRCWLRACAPGASSWRTSSTSSGAPVSRRARS
uniref:acyl-CoA dehydrogenase family protein n=1 Tax=Bradyrhizobium sp. (strain ORS 278) TaxID=114615 RepID=UPI001FCB106C|nr:acyl-CoA dehydrogenase family protein [Bradyrhizobium sp. ORS 278]